MAAFLSQIPSVEAILTMENGKRAVAAFGHTITVKAIRSLLEEERLLIGTGNNARSAFSLALSVFERLGVQYNSTLRPVLNLTGTILHTNLGRAQLPECAIEAAIIAMREPVTLEYDINYGKRGDRDAHIRTVLCQLTGAENATIVNNNAAAISLVLNHFTRQKKHVIISRGELIEIGGAFRIPEIMAAAGATLKEVGTTNRTYREDYIRAIDDNTSMILKVHPSNYTIQGFTHCVDTQDLAAIARDHKILLVEDLGSGTLVDLTHFGLSYEPRIQDVIRAGANLVTFSGDKLLGGPQAGFIIGQRDLIESLNHNPMKRSLRLDKIRLAALDALLRLYLSSDELRQNLPILRFLSYPIERMRALAESLIEPVQRKLGERFSVMRIDCYSQIGSGASPVQTLPSAGIAICCNHKHQNIADLAAQFRALPVPVMGYIRDQQLRFDLRLLEDREAFLVNLESLSL